MAATKKAATEKPAKPAKTAAPKKVAAKSAAKAAASTGTVKITQIRSANNRPKYQIQVLTGLGLNKMHRTRELNDTPSVRGMIEKVRHLLRVES